MQDIEGQFSPQVRRGLAFVVSAGLAVGWRQLIPASQLWRLGHGAGCLPDLWITVFQGGDRLCQTTLNEADPLANGLCSGPRASLASLHVAVNLGEI